MQMGWLSYLQGRCFISHGWALSNDHPLYWKTSNLTMAHVYRKTCVSMKHLIINEISIIINEISCMYIYMCVCVCLFLSSITLWLFNIAMENCLFIDGLPIKNGDFPWLCWIARGYINEISLDFLFIALPNPMSQPDLLLLQQKLARCSLHRLLRRGWCFLLCIYWKGMGTTVV